jgi:transposase
VQASSILSQPRPPRWAANREDTTEPRRCAAGSVISLWIQKVWCLRPRCTALLVPDRDGVRLLLEGARTEVSSLKHLWLDAGYEGRGKRWIEEVLGLSVEIVRRPPKPIPEKVAMRWVEEWAKEGEKPNWEKLLVRRGFQVLPRRWVVERTFSHG